VDETVSATPAPVDNELFLRGEQHLFLHCRSREEVSAGVQPSGWVVSNLQVVFRGVQVSAISQRPGDFESRAREEADIAQLVRDPKDLRSALEKNIETCRSTTRHSQTQTLR